MYQHTCEECKITYPKTTRYHRCKCGGQLMFPCPKCNNNIKSSNLKHIQKCSFVPNSTKEISTNLSIKFLYGKRKIMMSVNGEKICVAYYCDTLKRVMFGKERPKNKHSNIYSKKKQKMQYLKEVNSISLPQFSSIEFQPFNLS